MINFTTTTISDKKTNVSISDSGFIETETQIDKYNHASDTVDHSNYSATDINKISFIYKIF